MFWLFLVMPVIYFFVRDVAYTGVCIHLFGDVSAADKQQQAA
jgi:dolichol kinase